MNPADVPDWRHISARAGKIPEAAFQFIRDGLQHTVKNMHGEDSSDPRRGRHVTGQQLCLGLRDLAIARWGLLAGAVLKKWGLRSTEDFGIIVYSLIERGEMRNSPDDSFDDFKCVYEFDEVFGSPAAMA